MRIASTLTFIGILFTFSLFAQTPPPIDWDKLQESAPWQYSEQHRSVTKVNPKNANGVPSDAVVLFDGRNLDAWQKAQLDIPADMKHTVSMIEQIDPEYSGAKPDWKIVGEAMEVMPGSGAIQTKQAFGDVQLHVEWLAPKDQKEGQFYSNSGIFLMGLYEIQVLNSYDNETYANGQAGAVYKQHPPMVNASLPPDTWQTYDIIFNAPIFDNQGNQKYPARVTVLHNGVLIQNDAKILGPTVYIGAPHGASHPAKLPLILQDHGDKVKFRNIWIREL